jgi:hypothetical protein
VLVFVSAPLVAPLALPAPFLDGEGAEVVEEDEEDGNNRCLRLGFGKLDFLSIASTVRWKRRKRASARTRVDSRSIELDSSLTVVVVSSVFGLLERLPQTYHISKLHQNALDAP